MTPVQDWTYEDYYAAIDRARWAWQQSNPQMVLCGWADALDEADRPRGMAGLVERTLSPIPQGALASGAEPGCGPLSGDVTLLATADTCVVSSAPSHTSMEADAKSPQTKRVRLQGGKSR